MTLDTLLSQAKALSAKKPNDPIKVRITYNGNSYIIQFANGQQLPELEPTL